MTSVSKKAIHPMPTPGHEMIMASAGSGKTYALTTRYVQLLALGAAPERIVALTFTRKAAGEFFDEILTKLARAAVDDATAAELAQNIGRAQLKASDFCQLLRRMVDAMPRLALGTFDAFFARIVRSFPLELGLGGDFTLLEEYAAQFERRRVLRALFAHTGREPDEAQREFIESFKRATFGREEKKLAPLLDGFIDEHQRDFLAAPRAELWGDPARIWPGGCPWLEPVDPAAATALLRGWAMTGAGGSDPGQQARWACFLDTLETWAPGLNPPRPLAYILEKVLAAGPELGRTDVTLKIERRKQVIPAAIGSALRQITQSIFAGEYTRRLASTRGLHGVLAAYETGYEALVRRAGRLTFADVERLLGSAELASGPYSTINDDVAAVPPGDQILLPLPGLRDAAAEGSPTLVASRAERRLLLDWRLDAQFDHWLLDEFQDTSRGQWDVLRNLIDEIVQDASQARTFFCVGDIKQAIYGWRGGDTRLFREILEHYNGGGPSPAIKLTPMDASWRSGPAILELVNRVFGDADALADLSPAASVRWSQDWRPHTSAVPTRHGQAAWLHAEDEAARFQRTRDLLEEIRPLERGLSVAILTQKNETATSLADFLRRELRMPVVAEADLHACIDNPATSAVLSLLKAAAHPGDTLAAAHVQMTPLRAALAHEGLNAPEALTGFVLGQVQTEGFAATVDYWWRRLEPALAAEDTFTHGRGRQLVEAARRFDETGNRDVAEFLQFAARHVVRDSDSAGVVRVMTIHKAKGLGFDLVILPDLEGNRLVARRNGLAVHRDAAQEVEWVLDLPTKFFREQDATLAAHTAGEEADNCHEKIALLYVALTRAKHAMYLITSAAVDSASRSFPRLLAAALGCDTTQVSVGRQSWAGGYSAGDTRWFEAVPAAAPARSPARPAAYLPAPAVFVKRHTARTPSDQHAGQLRGATLFAPAEYDAADFGTAVHTALAAVTWWDPALAARWAAQCRAEGLPETAVAEARACFDSPALAAIFRPAENARTDVWREQAFEYVQDDVWITGRFDRVLLERNAAGVIARVRVIDFKTGRVDAGNEAWQKAAERYRPQVVWYRRAAAILAHVAESCVSCEIVLTAARDDSGRVPGPLVLA